MTKLYTIEKYNYHVPPVTREMKDATITTWKYDDDATFFNFEIQFPLEKVQEDFWWEDGSFFEANYGDMIERIGTVVIKDGLLIIAGLKQKGNEESK